MNNNVTLVSVKGWSRDKWLAYRSNGIGASEVGAILGLSEYKTPHHVFYEKIGMLGHKEMSVPAFMGTVLEPIVAKLWKHYDGSVESMMQNVANNKPVRKCRDVKAYAHNPKYPWLYASIDREIIKTKKQRAGALEIKTIKGIEKEKWKEKIPYTYIAQLQAQLTVCMFDYGELAMLVDNMNYEQYCFETQTFLEDEILAKTEAFWQKVLKGREAIKDRQLYLEAGDRQAIIDMDNELQEIMPYETIDSPLYLELLTERYKNKLSFVGERDGSDEELRLCVAHRELKNQFTELEEKVKCAQAEIVLKMGEHTKLNFADGWGYVSNLPNKKGALVFLNKVKTIASE